MPSWNGCIRNASKSNRNVSQFVGDMLAEKMAVDARSDAAIEMQQTF